MSLISEALKKAQATRPASGPALATPGMSPPPPGLSQPPPIPTWAPGATPELARNRNAGPLMLVMGGAIFLVTLVLGFAAVTWLLSSREAGTPEAEANQIAPESVAATSAPAVSEPNLEASAAQAVPAPSAAPPAEASPALATTAAVPASPPAPAPIPLSEANAQVLARLSQFEVRGVLGNGRRALIEDSKAGWRRGFSVGDRVDIELGLRVAAINADNIQFVDDAGYVYTKQF